MRALTGGLLGIAFAVVFACGVDAQRSDPGPSDAGPIVDSAAPDAAEANRTVLHVLFIGNSYTYVNDVPGLLARIAETAPSGPRIVTDSLVQGGATLQNHLEGGAPDRIADKTWTHVVLQGQSLEPVTPEYFLPSATTLAELATDAGARPAWFVTWARAPEDAAYASAFTSPDELQDRLTAAYDEAARQAPGSMLVCVGEAFRASLGAHPEIRLHQDDGSHASLAGSYLAASTFYVALTGGPVPASSEIPAGLDDAQAAALRSAANVGVDCRDAHVKAAIHVSGAAAYDFGTAGTSIPVVFSLTNQGSAPATLSDGHTLLPPFEWTDGGFPCPATLAPGETCKVSVSFSGKSSGTSRMTIVTEGAYQASITRSLTGTATDRALLTVSEWADDACLRCQPLYLSGSDGFTFVVTNRGAIPTTSIDIGDPLTSPLSWGDGFPGGTGSSVPTFPPAVTLPFCGSVLAPGAQCLVRIRIEGSDAGSGGGQVPATDAGPPLERSVTLRYADAQGAITTYASRAVELRAH
jgi:hypothetical protein